MVLQRLAEVANDIVTQLTRKPEGCFVELQGAARDLDRCGCAGKPSWEALKASARPPAPELTEPGEWLHGCQHQPFSSSEYHVLPQSFAADQAQSHSGPGSSSLFARIPRLKCNHLRSPKLGVSAGPNWTSWAGTERARDQTGCVRGHCQWDELWHEFAEKQGHCQMQLSIA